MAYQTTRLAWAAAIELCHDYVVRILSSSCRYRQCTQAGTITVYLQDLPNQRWNRRELQLQLVPIHVQRREIIAVDLQVTRLHNGSGDQPRASELPDL